MSASEREPSVTTPYNPAEQTVATLKRDFDLDVTLAPDRLCPPVPVRLNHVDWVSSIVDNPSAVGCDIGIGASCIYPLLAVRRNPGWHMHGTEIDRKNYEYAGRNVEANGLGERITLHFRDSLPDVRLDFVMTNPPFYSSEDDFQSSSELKARPAATLCTGAPVEMICPGGDAGFVLRLIDSTRPGVWYSSMLGKLSSLYTVVAELRRREWSYAVTRLISSRTRRWAVAWNSGGLPRLDNAIARGRGISAALLPASTEVTLRGDASRLEGVFELHGIDWDSETGKGCARDDTWSRAARRNGRGLDRGSLNFQTVVGDAVTVRWIKGEQAVFRSFIGMLRRALVEEET